MLKILEFFSLVLVLAQFTFAQKPIGSIEAHGPVRVGDLSAPSISTLFAGDLITTYGGTAIINHKSGSRVVLASESQASFSSSVIQLQKGLMVLQTIQKSGVLFKVSTLHLEPIGIKISANITFNDQKASVSVTEGSLKVVDPSGVQLAQLNSGEARLFEEAVDQPESSGMATPEDQTPKKQWRWRGFGILFWKFCIGFCRSD